MPTPPASPHPALLVACLCAQWCGTCGSYRSVFAQLEAEFPGCRFLWIDVEDEASLVEPIEVENFPTLLIAAQGQARFFGTVTPHLDTARRLIQAQLAPGAAAAVPSALVTDVNQLLLRLR
jgi:thiol-disulfide isomerase/thioredoxin